MSLIHSPNIVTNGLTLYLDAANIKSYPGTGNKWYDLSTQHHSPTLINTPSYSTNNHGMFTFNGTNQKVDCGQVYQINSNTSNITASVWFYATDVQDFHYIIKNGTTYPTTTFHLMLNSHYMTFLVYGTDYNSIMSNNIFEANTWYNVVGNWNSSTGVSMYINGKQITTYSTSGTHQTTVIDGSTNLFIGCSGNSQYYFAGSIPIVQLYYDTLNPYEILQNFNALRGRFGI